MTRNLVCNECGGKMETGFIVETIQGGFPYDAAYWMQGSKERGWFGRLKTSGREKYYISAFRCERCGFMKFYAGPDHSAKE